MPSSHSPPPLELLHTAELLPSGGRLQVRLTLLTLLLVGLLTALSSFLVRGVFSSMTPSLTADLRWKAQRGVAELSHSADLGVLTGDLPLLLGAAKHYTDDTDFVYVQFRNAERQVLLERGSAAGLPTPEEAPEAVVENPVAFLSWAPVVIEGLRVGDVTLAVSKHRLQAGTLLYRRMLLLGLLGASAALGVALWFVRSHVVPILRVTERTSQQLQRTAKAALASAEAKSQFLANMSHEIRTPMNGMLGMLHLAQQTDLNTQQRRYLDIMSKSARSLLQIVNDILNFSKLNAGSVQLRPEPCSPRELIEETVTLFEQRAAEKGLRLNAEIAASVPDAVLLDGDRFRQILGNLVGNAIKFTDRGSVTVSVLAARAGPGVASGSAPVLEVAVQDTGPGIPESAQARLFQAFSQVDESSRRAHEGTGLGLAICKQLVELMAGTVGYRRLEEGGSRFHFVLPLNACERARPRAGAPAEPVVLPANERPLLLVDDNEVNQLVAVELLEGLGLRVDVASSGQDAIEAVQSGDYALILMDCQMPGMDGYETTREIRRRHPGRKLPIVAFTAHALPEEREKVLRCGMDDYLTKPIEPAELAALLFRHLGSAPRSARPPPPAAPRARSNPPLRELADAELLQLGLRRPPKAVEAFSTRTPGELALLEQAAREGRYDEIRRIAHKLKGSAGSLGALQLARLCERLEHIGKDVSEERLSELVVALRDAFLRVSAALQRQQQQTSPGGAP